MTATAGPIDVGELIDGGRWGGYQRWLVFLTALTIVFDGIDNQLMGVTIPTIMREWSVARSAFAPVVSLGYLGMVTGGALAGLLGDRIGRRVTLIASMIVFGGMTLAVAGAASVAVLAVLRFLAGLGLGGAVPNAAALAAEYVPKAQRPMAVTITIVCVPLGATLAGLAAIPALPAFGWRAMFLVGGLIPLVAAAALIRLLPESPRFLARDPQRRGQLAASLRRMGHPVSDAATFVDRTDAVARGRLVSALFTPEFRADTIGLWAAFFSCLLSVYLAFSWVPSMLAAAGFTTAIASAGIMSFNLGGVAGAVIGGLFITRWGSRPAMLTMAGLAVASASVMAIMPFSAGSPAAPIIGMLTVTGALINGVQTTMFALAAHVYPARIRTTGVGGAVSFGRIGAVVSGYVGAWALDFHGAMSFFGVIAVALVVCCLALASIARHVPGRQRAG